ncbi:MAG TPA: hypothetical protein PLC42_00465 [Parachlamydiaceae bacterium]|nr:hypothetical protein [Parachlamydiaceae bacterium]
MNPNEVKQVFSCTSFRPEKTASTEYEMVTHNLHSIKIIQEKMSDALYDLKNNQDLAALNQECQRRINALIETDGTINGQKFNGMMQDLKTNLDHKLVWEKKDLENQTDINPRAKKFLENISHKYQPFFDFIENTIASGNEIKKEDKAFTKEQAQRLISNIEMDLKEVNSDHAMKVHQLSRLNNETHERHQSVKTMLQNLHSLYMGIIRNIRAGRE